MNEPEWSMPEWAAWAIEHPKEAKRRQGRSWVLDKVIDIATKRTVENWTTRDAAAPEEDG